MANMNAAVVTCFGEPPHYQQFEVPEPMTTSRRWSTSWLSACTHGSAPTPRGSLQQQRHAADDPRHRRRRPARGRQADLLRVRRRLIGTMAERALVDARRAIELPDDVDVAKVAAAMNPAMSSWVALRRRVPIQAGQSVLVLGATGNAGTMAVQVAKRLGAGRVVGAGRDQDRLAALVALGADAVVAAHRRRRRDGGSARRRGCRGRHRDRLPMGRARAGRDGRAAQRRVRIAAARSTGSRSARSPDRRSSWRLWRCARPTCDSRAPARARSRRAATSRSCRRWWPRSTPARSPSGRVRRRWPRSNESGSNRSSRASGPCWCRDGPVLTTRDVALAATDRTSGRSDRAHLREVSWNLGAER